MENIDCFEAALQRAASDFKKISSKSTVKLVSNLDADGITAASIMVRVLERQGLNYSLMILHQLNEENSQALAEEGFPVYIFCDLGSGQLANLSRYFKDKIVFVLDHHEVQGKPAKNIIHVNPHECGFDGSGEISAAGVCFMFATAVDKKNQDLAHLAVIGAIGDVQEKDGFIGLNNKIFETALANKSIRVERGLRLFGLETRPLNKLLKYSADLSIPGVSEDDKGVAAFLKEFGISLCDGKGKWRTYYDLSEKEKRNLTEGIIKRRKDDGMKDAEKVFTNVYIFEGEKRGHFRDAKEFSTLLNSCGRMDHAELGIGACLKDEKARKKAVKSLCDYKRKLISSMIWYKANEKKEGSDRIIKGHNYLIINAKEDIMSTIIGTVASMISKGGMKEKLFVLSMARNGDGTTKVSLRASGNPEGVDLKVVIAELTRQVGGEAGGHKAAAGAVILTAKENEFIEKAKELFERYDF